MSSLDRIVPSGSPLFMMKTALLQKTEQLVKTPSMTISSFPLAVFGCGGNLNGAPGFSDGGSQDAGDCFVEVGENVLRCEHDYDGDGFINSEDECPLIDGSDEYGCPPENNNNGRPSDPNDNMSDGPVCTGGDEYVFYSGPAGTAGTGICREGIQTCMGGGWEVRSGNEETLPTLETCDGVDQNCDGFLNAHTSSEPTTLVEANGWPHETRYLWNGSNFGLFWTDSENQKASFRRFDETNNPLSDPIVLDESFTSELIDATWNGEEYGIVINTSPEIVESSSDEVSYFIRLTSGGYELSRDSILHGGIYETALTPTNEGYGLAFRSYSWTDLGRIYFIKIDSDGNPVPNEEGNNFRLMDTYQVGIPSLAWNDEDREFGLMYSNGAYTGACCTHAGVLKFLRLDEEGSLIDGEVSWGSLTGCPGPECYAHPSLLWTGSKYLVAYENVDDVLAIKLSGLDDDGDVEWSRLAVEDAVGGPPWNPVRLALNQLGLGLQYYRSGEIFFSLFTVNGDRVMEELGDSRGGDLNQWLEAHDDSFRSLSCISCFTLGDPRATLVTTISPCE